jgi:hypothetical protein
MARAREQPDREDRITNEVVVDAYNEAERAIGWYYYLADRLRFPFTAKCFKKRDTSPLRVGESVEVVGMAKEDDCMAEVFVFAKHGKSKLAVPLGQLECLSRDNATGQAVADWHYWLARGYEY